ncbi:2'-5' RNA ligase family protein [Nocardioides mangrovicus]|uniref:2'-5' RNA ligase family protein n=1 Tax=Nocardioides mangrovicus TaxID=2478913 RepID=UPI00131445C2|nr:2'-5' RNA ligase family protein [Nocardioides mangrovicus]
MSAAFRAGQTGLIAPVPAAEAAVGDQRAAHDSSTQLGVPAHVTVLFPFLELAEVDDQVLDELARLVRGHGRFEVAFRAAGRFPGVLWLDPDPDVPFRALTGEVAHRWPQCPPYEGVYDDVVPHLTVAEGDDEVLDAAERVVLPRLPVVTSIAEVRLIGFDGGQWETVARFDLA